MWFVWGLSAQQTESRIRGEQSAEAHIQYAEDRIDRECLALEGVALRDCIHQEIESAKEHARANQDLEAQQTMALFTKIMGATAVVGVFLGLGSVVLIYLTLAETQKLATETTRLGEAQVRAYLAITSAFVDNFAVGKKPKLHIAIKNSGQSPAWGYRTVRTVGFINTDPEKENITIIGEVIPSKSDVGAGVTVYMNELIPREVSEDDVRGVKAGEYSFVVGGISCYTTVFGQKRKTVFKLRSVYYSEKEERVILSACAKNNRSN